MAKVGFGFLFLYLRHVSLFVRSLPGWRLGLKKEIKPILSVGRKKNQLFYLLIHTEKPFSFKEKPKEVICHSGRNCRNNMKSAFPKDFSPRQMHLAFQWQQRAVCCAVLMLQRRMGCISPELQKNKPCPPAAFRSGWSVCPSVSSMVLLPIIGIQNSLAVAVFTVPL